MPLQKINNARTAARTTIKLVGMLALALVGMLIPAPAGALALPVFSVNVEHQTDPVSETPGTVTRADHLFRYKIAFSNSSPPAAGPEVGTTLKCSTGTWTNLPAEYSGYQYRWTHNATNIAGQTSNEYTVAPGDAGQAVQCIVKAANATGAGESSSVPIMIPATPGGSPPAGPVPPSTFTLGLEGSLAVGGTGGAKLTCPASTTAAWTNSPTFSQYTWYRNGNVIAGANTFEYIVTKTDLETAGSFQCSVVGTANGVSAFKGFSAARSTTSPAPNPSMPAANAASAPVAGVTIPATTVDLTLPVGVTAYTPNEAGGVSGEGWTCTQVAPYKCTRVSMPGSGGNAFPPIKFPAKLDGSIAPDELTFTATLSGGGALLSASGSDTFTLAPRPLFGARTFSADALDSLGQPFTQAGGHPYSAFSTNSFVKYVGGGEKLMPIEDPKTINVELPPGFIGNPLRLPKCASDLLALRKCPVESQVGIVTLSILQGVPVTDGVYALKPTGGHPAEFAFLAASVGEIHLFPKVRSDGDYGITMSAPYNTQAQLSFVNFKFWGTPADPRNDSERCIVDSFYSACQGGAPSSAPLRALLTNPTNCGPQVTGLVMDSWQNPGQYVRRDYNAPPTTGCAALNAAWTSTDEPSISLQPETSKADTPSGYNVNIHVPQEGLADPDALAPPNLYGSTVKLPEGLAISAAAANGLQSCTEAQMGLTSSSPIHFDLNSVTCPDASKVGAVEVQTPMLADPLKGSIYLAAQDANPFKSRFAMYLVVEDKAQGLMLKLAGKVVADPVTGQLTSTFMENPQLPFTDLRLRFFDGPQAALVNPSTCGTFTTNAALTPWSAVDPAHPTAAETASPSDSFVIDSAPGGGSCAKAKSGLPFSPSLDAGSVSTKAGATTPFVLKLSRADGQQELTSLDVVAPKGLTASLKGIPYCSEAQIAAAKAKTSGAAEKASPSCPAASQIGTVVTGAGAGSAPLYVGGKAYLAGPYKGAALSMVIVTPAVAGPFDLGNVVVRAPMYVDPVTAQITVKSDPIPQILDGVPLQVRSVAVSIDRPGFTRNPTNCEPMTVNATVNGASGAVAGPSSRFQVGGCKDLGFAPKLALSLSGPTHRSAFPKLRAVLTARDGDSNIGRAQVTLPKTEFLEQAHIRTVCTRVQYAAKACPEASVYGYARAWSPLLDQPLEGPVYLRSSDNELPDLVASLDGQIHVDLVGRIDSIHARIRNTFDVVPDAPVSKFELTMQGGKKGLLVNNTELCGVKARATAFFTGQNGKTQLTNPLVKAGCKKAKKANRKAHR